MERQLGCLHLVVATNASAGLRTVALFEGIKGAVVLLLACGVLDLMHKNPSDVAEQLVKVLHGNPDGRLSQVFVLLANHATDSTLWVLAVGALGYAAVRLTAAYGLWRSRGWARCFELLCTALYLPPEFCWLLRHPSWLRCGVLDMNIVILVFMLTLWVKGSLRSHAGALTRLNSGVAGETKT